MLSCCHIQYVSKSGKPKQWPQDWKRSTLIPIPNNVLTIWQLESSPILVSEVKVAQSCLTICDPMDCGLLGSEVHEILQTRILECVFIPFYRGSSQPMDQI